MTFFLLIFIQLSPHNHSAAIPFLNIFRTICYQLKYEVIMEKLGFRKNFWGELILEFELESEQIIEPMISQQKPNRDKNLNLH